MTYQEWISQTNNQAIVRTKYPKLDNYLKAKYANYELKYSELVFAGQLSALLITYENVLSSIETSLRLREENAITLDNLGRTQKTKRIDNNTSNIDDTLKYVGYEVVGDYEKNIKGTTFERNLTDTTNEYNLYEQFIRLESIGTRVAWTNFEKAFLKLFITIYTLDI